jgi:hypothetical protein
VTLGSRMSSNGTTRNGARGASALTAFDSPRTMISPPVDRTETSVSARHVVLTMMSVTGSIWMLDNVDK